MSDIVEVIVERFRALGLPRADCVRGANEALHALEQAGYAVVPVVPTEAMIEGARGIPISAGQAEHAFIEDCDACSPGWLRDFWRAMIAAYKHPAADTAGPTRSGDQEDRNPDS